MPKLIHHLKVVNPFAVVDTLLNDAGKLILAACDYLVATNNGLEEKYYIDLFLELAKKTRDESFDDLERMISLGFDSMVEAGYLQEEEGSPSIPQEAWMRIYLPTEKLVRRYLPL